MTLPSFRACSVRLAIHDCVPGDLIRVSMNNGLLLILNAKHLFFLRRIKEKIDNG